MVVLKSSLLLGALLSSSVLPLAHGFTVPKTASTAAFSSCRTMGFGTVSSSTSFATISSSGRRRRSTVGLYGTLKESGERSEKENEELEKDDDDSSIPLDIKTLVEKETKDTSLSDTTNGINGVPSSASLEGNETEEIEMTEEELMDIEMMEKAIQLAQSCGGERGSHSPFPKPIAGAVVANSRTGKILGRGRTDCDRNAVLAAIADAGIDATPLSEWCVTWPKDSNLRKELKESTLYVTLEPSAERNGASLPPITQLIELSGIPRVVIGAPDPIPELSSEGAAALHSAGLTVIMGVLRDECQSLITEYSSDKLANSKLQKMARRHFERFGRPLGFLHCSVVESDDVESFARNGNAFGKNFGGKHLSFRDFGSYKLAPPPESIWATDSFSENDFTEVDDFFNMDFEEEEYQETLGTNPMMPWYEQVDAVVATFPKEGNGPADDNSVTGRLNGLKWLSTHGNALPANVERILVMDATDLPDLPLTNDDPNLPKGVDVEAFWTNKRKPRRVLLRHGDNAQAIAAANSAAKAAEAAADAAKRAKEAIESGEAESAAEAALECQQAALAATAVLQKEIQIAQDLRQRLTKMGVKVEVIKGGEPIDVMNHLGQRNGYKAVVWRAGCWGERGVQAIVAGAFQWVSAHLAVDAAGGKFWQLMLAERAVQAACGPEAKVKVFSEQEDISLEYCDEEDPDTDCVLTVNGQPIRHVRLDCRVLVVDPDRPHEVVMTKTAPLKDRVTDEAPWFL